MCRVAGMPAHRHLVPQSTAVNTASTACTAFATDVLRVTQARVMSQLLPVVFLS